MIASAALSAELARHSDRAQIAIAGGAALAIRRVFERRPFA